MKSKHLFITTVLIILSSLLTVGNKTTKAEEWISPFPSYFEHIGYNNEYGYRHKLPKLYRDLIKVYSFRNVNFRSSEEDYNHTGYLKNLFSKRLKQAIQIIPEKIKRGTIEAEKLLENNTAGGHLPFDRLQFYEPLWQMEVAICMYRSMGIPDEIIQERLDEAIDYLYRGIANDFKREQELETRGAEEEWKRDYYQEYTQEQFDGFVDDYMKRSQNLMLYLKEGMTLMMNFSIESGDRECKPNQINHIIRSNDLQYLKNNIQ